MRSFSGKWIAVLALWAVQASSAGAQPQQPDDPDVVDVEGDPGEGADGVPEAPEQQVPTGPSGIDQPTQWRQLLANPRIGGRFTAIAVDWDDANKIYIGTEESTIFVTNDGGVTWQERPLTPFVTQLRSIGSTFIPLAGRSRPPVFNFGVPLDYRGFTDQDPLIVNDYNYETRGIPATGMTIPTSAFPVRNDPLGDALTPRYTETVPVQRIAVCPQSRYPLIVATYREVFGSQDDGVTFVRLYGSTSNTSFLDRNSPQINDVDCSPSNPNDLIISSSRGVIRSLDGGLSFTNNVRGANSGAATAATFDIAGAAAGGPIALLVANDTLLYIGDVDSPEGLQYVYPDFDDPSNAPYFSIRWIVTTESAQIWMATDFGVRASLDGGQSWFYPERALFGSEPIVALDYGTGIGDRERVAIATRDRIWATDDSGRTWFPFYFGYSRRTIQYVASGPPAPDGRGRWFVITSGELWATHEPPTRQQPLPEEPSVRSWALRRLRSAPTMQAVQQDAFDRLSLETDDIDGLLASQRSARALPFIEARLTTLSPFTSSFFDISMSAAPLTQDRDRDAAGITFFVQGTWDLPDLIYAPQTARWRGQLIDLRKQVGFVIEDAWNEREIHLIRLARGVPDPLEAETLRGRIEILETVLETWTGHPMGEELRAEYARARSVR